MTGQTYSQAEADALIAGAYLAQRKLIEEWRERHYGQLTPRLTDAQHLIFVARERCADELEQALTPDAARLALEERDAKLIDAAVSAFKDAYSDCDDPLIGVMYGLKAIIALKGVRT